MSFLVRPQFFLQKLALSRTLCSKPKKLTEAEFEERLKAKRQEYLAFEQDWESRVVLDQLSEQEKAINSLHKEAIEGLHWTYIDPQSGKKVFTRLRHYLKGRCCGSACRHCVYNHENVSADKQGLKVFNSAFWVDRPQEK